ncbi:nitrous oxide reductase accessory protein NosL [Sinobaca sp. H24]|uniref:nitrous oxide reductase accessory protein NosL n=1 Tax=Sinobaca sp. H24 TaxID=2923376 RepID=UPI00207A898A|nr:nitrous oxide reductase accessory protein NosL [Sinobaca sp. H24]
MHNKKLMMLMPFVFFAGACQQLSHDPHDIDHHVDTCEICNMSIVRVEEAAQIVKEDGTAVLFDDVGCLMEYKEIYASESDEFHTEYAQDYELAEWFDMEEGAYVYDEDIQTPMGNGVVSFESEENAQAFIDNENNGEGTLYQYEDLPGHEWDSHL